MRRKLCNLKLKVRLNYILIVVLPIFFTITVYGQQRSLFDSSNNIHKKDSIISPLSFDYSKVDSIALHFPKKSYKSYTEIVAPLTASLKTDPEKVRVIFRWITDNIKYNFGNKSDDPDKAIKNKKAVCIGYSTLFKEMCNSAGVECEVVEGYSKTTINDIDKKLKKTDHAWNVVKLYGKWYLIDVTWATSYFDEEKHKIITYYDEFYYLTPPNIFVRNHYPKDKKWQLLDKPVTKPQFVRPFVYFEGFSQTNLKDLQPSKGIINLRLKDTLELKLFTDSVPKEVIIELGNNQFNYLPEIHRMGKFYLVKQKIEKAGLYKLTIFSNQKEVAEYKLIMKE